MNGAFFLNRNKNRIFYICDRFHTSINQIRVPSIDARICHVWLACWYRAHCVHCVHRVHRVHRVHTITHAHSISVGRLTNGPSLTITTAASKNALNSNYEGYHQRKTQYCENGDDDVRK